MHAGITAITELAAKSSLPNRLPPANESRKLFLRAEAAQRLQGRNRARGDCLAARSSHHTSPLFELALVLVRFDHVARVIVNADHSMM
jgi:hypothetical protein